MCDDLERNKNITARVNIKLLRSLRETRKYRISDIATYLGYQVPGAYWFIETGQRNLSIEALYKLSRLYDCSIEDLLIVSRD